MTEFHGRTCKQNWFGCRRTVLAGCVRPHVLFALASCGGARGEEESWWTVLAQRFFSPETQLPGRLKPLGIVKLCDRDIGNDEEVLEDCARALAAGGVHVLHLYRDARGVHLPTAPVLVLPPAGVTSPVNSGQPALAACADALSATLSSGCSPAVSDCALLRLVRMLSVGPAVSMLMSVDCPPSLQEHRFVIVCSSSSIRALTVGFLPDEEGVPCLLLTIASPCVLLEPEPDGVQLSYVVRPVEADAQIELEVAKELTTWANTYCSAYAE